MRQSIGHHGTCVPTRVPAFCLLLALTFTPMGCKGPEVKVNPTLVDSLRTSLGVMDLTLAPPDKIRAELERITGERFSAVRFVNGVLMATMEPIAQEVVRKVGPSLVEQIASNPTPAGIVSSLLGIGAVVYGIFSGRAKVEAPKP